jgi:hypothetical protein
MNTLGGVKAFVFHFLFELAQEKKRHSTGQRKIGHDDVDICGGPRVMRVKFIMSGADDSDLQIAIQTLRGKYNHLQLVKRQFDTSPADKYRLLKDAAKKARVDILRFETVTLKKCDTEAYKDTPFCESFRIAFKGGSGNIKSVVEYVDDVPPMNYLVPPGNHQRWEDEACVDFSKMVLTYYFYMLIFVRYTPTAVDYMTDATPAQKQDFITKSQRLNTDGAAVVAVGPASGTSVNATQTFVSFLV